MPGILLLDIGNTNTAFAVSDGIAVPEAPETLPTSELSELPLGDCDAAAAATVVPGARTVLSCRSDIFWLDNSHAAAAGLDLSQVNASTLGADRLANAIELRNSAVTLPAAVFDFGTAIDCEIVDREGFFRGGAILPGRMLMRKALFQGTARLPQLDFRSFAPDKAGTDTASTMYFGMDRGIIGAVRELMECIRRQFGSDVFFCATGGDADFFTSQIPDFKRSDPMFTLRGILRAWQAAR